MECFGYPNITIQWKDNHGKNIELNKFNGSKKFEARHNCSKDITTLKIKHLSPRDSGIYTLQLSNNNETRQEKFELFVKGISPCICESLTEKLIDS